MKKLAVLAIVMAVLACASVANASKSVKLTTGTKNIEVGTTANPIKITMAGGSGTLKDLSVTRNLSVGNPALYVDGVNNLVGIGTVTPTRKLHIYGSDVPLLLETVNSGQIIQEFQNTTADWFVGMNSGEDFIFTINSNISNEAGIKFLIEQDGNIGISDVTPDALLDINQDLSASTTPLFIAQDATTDGFIITSEGKVGIGTATPNVPLLVKSSGLNTNVFNCARSGGTEVLISVAESSSGNGILNVRNSSNDQQFKFDADPNSDSYLVGSNGGNVGIGTTAPTATLEVAGDIKASGNVTVDGSDERLEFGDGGSFIDGNDAGADTLSFVTDLTQTIVMDTSGKLGIGTATPAQMLHIRAGGGGARIELDDIATVQDWSMRVNGSNYEIVEDGEAAVLVVADGANVGIGTTVPGSKLFVQDNTAAWAAQIDQDHASGFGLKILTDGNDTNPAMRIETGLGNVFNVTHIGNVGIGTIDPTEKLEVNGNVTMSGNLYVEGKLTVKGGTDPAYISYEPQTFLRIEQYYDDDIALSGNPNQPMVFFDADFDCWIRYPSGIYKRVKMEN